VHVRGKRVLRRTRTNNEAGDALGRTTDWSTGSLVDSLTLLAPLARPSLLALSLSLSFSLPLSSPFLAVSLSLSLSLSAFIFPYLSTCFIVVHRSSALRNLAAFFGSTGSSTPYLAVSWNRGTEEKRRLNLIWRVFDQAKWGHDCFVLRLPAASLVFVQLICERVRWSRCASVRGTTDETPTRRLQSSVSK